MSRNKALPRLKVLWRPETLLFSVLIMTGTFGFRAWAQDAPGIRPDSLAAPYLDQALDLEAQGKAAEALAWVARGQAFHPESSDLAYLAARLNLKAGAVLDLTGLRNALAWSNFSRFPIQDASALLATRLVLAGRALEAESHLQGIWSTQDILAFPVLTMAAARIREALGEHEKALALLDRALVRHPEQLELHALRIELSSFVPLAASQLLKRSKPESPGYDRLLSMVARRLGPDAEREDLLRRLFARSAASPWDAWLLAEHEWARAGTEASRTQVLVDFLKRGGGTDAQALLALGLLVGEDPSRKFLDAELARGSRVIHRDRARDGIAEETMIFEAGRLVQWKVDDDQDGLHEITLHWEGREPRFLDLRETVNGRVWRHDYAGNYPAVARTLLVNGPALVVLHHGWRSFEERLVDLPDGELDVLGALQLGLNGLAIPDEEHILEASHLLEVYQSRSAGNRVRRESWVASWAPLRLPMPIAGPAGNPETMPDFESAGKVLAQYRLEEGRILSGRVDEDLDGIADHDYVYDRGVLTFGYRSLPGLPGSTVERYDARGLAQVIHNNKGWTYELHPGSGLRLWDLNNDGKVDIKEFVEQNGRVWQSFSSKGDGTFDLLLDGSR